MDLGQTLQTKLEKVTAFHMQRILAEVMDSYETKIKLCPWRTSMETSSVETGEQGQKARGFSQEWQVIQVWDEATPKRWDAQCDTVTFLNTTPLAGPLHTTQIQSSCLGISQTNIMWICGTLNVSQKTHCIR